MDPGSPQDSIAQAFGSGVGGAGAVKFDFDLYLPQRANTAPIQRPEEDLLLLNDTTDAQRSTKEYADWYYSQFPRNPRALPPIGPYARPLAGGVPGGMMGSPGQPGMPQMMGPGGPSVFSPDPMMRGGDLGSLKMAPPSLSLLHHAALNSNVAPPLPVDASPQQNGGGVNPHHHAHHHLQAGAPAFMPQGNLFQMPGGPTPPLYGGPPPQMPPPFLQNPHAGYPPQMPYFQQPMFAPPQQNPLASLHGHHHHHPHHHHQPPQMMPRMEQPGPVGPSGMMGDPRGGVMGPPGGRGGGMNLGGIGGPGGAGGRGGPTGPSGPGNTSPSANGARPQRRVPSGPCSPLMEDFRSRRRPNLTLAELRGNMKEFSRDQEGSRHIQAQLSTCTPEEKDSTFREIMNDFQELVSDVFANYVIQKLIEVATPDQQLEVYKILENNVLQMTLQTYGCRIVQKCLESFGEEMQNKITAELHGNVARCIQDQNGNHVIQKCIEIMPDRVGFIVESFSAQVHDLATHAYGCRVIQRVLEFCSPENQHKIFVELKDNLETLVCDQYGNYVVQHVLCHGTQQQRSDIIALLTPNCFLYSTHKFASNVVEKMYEFSSLDQREDMLRTLMLPTADGCSGLLNMMKDQYANYVIQKIIDQSTDDQKRRVVEHIRPHVPTLRKFTYGKHIIARLERSSLLPSSGVPLGGPPGVPPPGAMPSPPHPGNNNGGGPMRPGQGQGGFMQPGGTTYPPMNQQNPGILY
eukprot:PhF_6_TR13563/c1_g1_i1/m.21685/K17943/PUM; pumilio RNA-binding family